MLSYSLDGICVEDLSRIKIQQGLWWNAISKTCIHKSSSNSEMLLPRGPLGVGATAFSMYKNELVLDDSINLQCILPC
jgi:hypothetical protein